MKQLDLLHCNKLTTTQYKVSKIYDHFVFCTPKYK